MLSRMIVVLSVMFVCASQAHADSAAILKFLSSLPGHYTGNGTTSHNDASGTSSKGYEFDLHIDVMEGNPNAIQLDSQLNGDDGSINGVHHRLIVNGGNLFYGDAFGSSVPVRIVESGTDSLTYSMNVYGYNGVVYDVTTKYSLAGDTLDVHTTTTTNSVVVVDDDFSGTRF